MIDTENTLAQSIDSSDYGPRYDEACKKVLAEKIILAWILKYCIAEYGSYSVDDIAEKFIEGTPEIASVNVLPDMTNMPRISGGENEDSSNTEGSVTFDIRFNAILPVGNESATVIINVEAQDDFYPGYPLMKRAIYYCSRLISSQYGTVFTQSHYEEIQKVYSIWICMSPPKNREYTITSYSFSETNIVGSAKEPSQNYDLATSVMICLGGKKRDSKNSLLDMLNTLLSTKTGKNEKKKILSEEFSLSMTEKIDVEVSDMCNLSAGVERRATQRGLQQGLQQAKIDAIKSIMETMNITMEKAMDALKIASDERQKYVSLLVGERG